MRGAYLEKVKVELLALHAQKQERLQAGRAGEAASAGASVVARD